MHAMLRRAAAAAAFVVLSAAPTRGWADPFGSSISGSCVGGAIGCTQFDFFLSLTNPAASTPLDFFYLTLLTSGMEFTNPELSEGDDATSYTDPAQFLFVDPVVFGRDASGTNRIFGVPGAEMVAYFPFQAALSGSFDPTLRVRAQFTAEAPSTFDFSYSGGTGDPIYDPQNATILVSGQGRFAPVTGTTTPEPVSLALLATGLAGVGAVRRRGRARSAATRFAWLGRLRD